MAAEAEAAREARAKVIAAEGEQKASRALKDAADVMSHSSAALQLRYLQTLNSIAGEKNSTIVFPVLPVLLLAFLSFHFVILSRFHWSFPSSPAVTRNHNQTLIMSHDHHHRRPTIVSQANLELYVVVINKWNEISKRQTEKSKKK